MDAKKAVRDRLYYFENCLKIRTKAATEAPLLLNQPQLILDKIIHATIQIGKAPRFIILKARQVGVSTYSDALLFYLTATKRFVSSVIAAHKDEPSLYLFDMCKNFYNHLPASVRPVKTYSSRRELVFVDPADNTKGLQSRMNVFTAGSVDLSRSRNFQNFHWSEVAFTPFAEATNDAVLSALPRPPVPHMVIYESTANGSTGLFHDLFMDAFRGKNEWTPIFLPWFAMDTYRMKVPQGVVLSSDESRIMEDYSLDLDQMAWRRWVLLNDFGGRVDRFMREYPSCPEEAFTTPEHGVFDRQSLLLLDQYICDPVDYCQVSELGLTSSPTGKLLMWSAPDKKEAYLITVDAAGGKSSGDLLVAEVWRVTAGSKKELVAVYADKVNPVVFAAHVDIIGRAYYNALCVPERNYHGVAVIATLNDRRYPNMFRDTRTDGDYGVHVSRTSRYLMVDLLGTSLLRQDVVIHHRRVVNALKSYQETNGEFHGPEDDFVDSAALMTYALSRRVVMPTSESAQRGWSDAWTAEDWDTYFENATRLRSVI